MSESRERIAVIGGGVAGIVSAYLLQRKYDVELFEANSYLGGHTNTITMESGPDAGLGVDTGFIVLNDRTYPLLTEFLTQLGVGIRYADMSFSMWCEKTGLQYASRNLNGLFAQRRNLLNPRFLKMLVDVRRFWAAAQDLLSSGVDDKLTLAEFLKDSRLSGGIVEDYIVPISAAIWSSPTEALMDFPVETFLQFYKNHGLLSYYDQPRWQTVVGGSQSYVRAFAAQFGGTIHLDAPVKVVQRSESGVRVVREDGEIGDFAKVIIAVHADQALSLLEEPSATENNCLLPWKYQKNHTVLHTDQAHLPPLERARASWNYRREVDDSGQEPVAVTYHMNRLQGFESDNDYCVTLNSRQPIREEAIIKEIEYTHPVFTTESVRGRNKLGENNGANNTWYCGSYFGFGFHEDAVSSAVSVATELGVAL